MAKKVEKILKDNRFSFRISNIETYNKINEIMATGIYSSKNELISRCVEMSIDEVLNTVQGKHQKLYREHESKCEELSHELHRRGKKWDNQLKELSINDVVNEKLLCTLFNMLIYQHAGKHLSIEDIQRGIYSDLPPFLQGLVQELST